MALRRVAREGSGPSVKARAYRRNRLLAGARVRVRDQPTFGEAICMRRRAVALLGAIRPRFRA